MEDYSTEDADRKRKIKIIATTCVCAVLVFGIGAIITISAISNIGQPNNNQSQTEKVTKVESSAETSKTEEDAPANNTKSSSASTSQSSVAKNDVTVTSTDIPTSGPADLLPAALLIGTTISLVGFGYNLRQTKN